ncbi:MAG: DNA mismatch repair protein MutS [Bacteroidota bacterium]
MIYIVFTLLLFVVFFLVFRFGMITRREKAIAKVKAGWARLKDAHYDFDEIEIYSQMDVSVPFHELSEQTQLDIDFKELFKIVDRTTSKVGQQFLFNRMKKPGKDITELKTLSERADFFRDHPSIREEIQELLVELDDNRSYYIATLLNNKLLERPKWFSWLIFNTITVVTMLLLSPWYPVLLAWMMIPFALNMGLHFWNKNNTYRFIRSLPQLNKLLKVAAKLVAKEIPFDHTKTKASLDNLKTFQRKMHLLSFGQQGVVGEMSQVFYYFLEMVKAVFLIELHTFYSIIKELENKQQAIQHLFSYVGLIDTSISVASLRAGVWPTCEPEWIGASKKMDIVKVYHPLIEDCVTNDLVIDNKSILITGSNMSGKTTFLRTVALNSVLAQTIHTCFAEKFSVPVLKLASSIRIDDSISEGKSYYLAEVDIMGKLIYEVKEGQQYLFILDEVFKGTNTVERVAAGKAILSYLNRFNNIVLVSTHDMELSGMLSDEYDLYHFVETIHDNQLFFDHLLKQGELKTRNAIRILEMADYPQAIITEAKEISKQIIILKNK